MKIVLTGTMVVWGAHTLLWYDRFGPEAFKRDAAAPSSAPRFRPPRCRYDVASMARSAPEADAAIWDVLVNLRRAVSRSAWDSLAAKVPPARPAGG